MAKKKTTNLIGFGLIGFALLGPLGVLDLDPIVPVVLLMLGFLSFGVNK